jgi:hypothetical protein
MHAKNTFGKAEKSVFLPMHVPQCMAKRGKLKKVKKKKKRMFSITQNGVPNSTLIFQNSASRHSNF